MENMQDFEAPTVGNITLCEVNGRVQTMPFDKANISMFTTSVDRHPKIHITRDLLHPSSKCMEEGKDLFVPVNVPLLKQLIQTYQEHGFIDVLDTLSRHRHLVVATGAQLLLKTFQKVQTLKMLFSPSLLDSSESVINQFSTTRNWMQSAVRCIAWHPDILKLAVAALDDTVRIYMANSNITPLLKCKHQKNITCIAWRPVSNSDIAVACEYGIIIWNIDPNSVVTRPSTNHAIILHRIEHKPVLSITWSPRGDILASVAMFDMNILLWDVEMDRTSSVKRTGITGYNLVKWSPSGANLFTSSTSSIFRIWACNNDWKVERWNVLSGRIQAMCWSPCSNHILFTTNEEPIVYGLSFNQIDSVYTSNTANAGNQAVELYDVSKFDIDGVIVGGIVQNMDWDDKGKYLAVLFQDTVHVSIFSVVKDPVLQLKPGFLISGTPEEIPNAIAFQPNFQEGTCLTVAWSSGRIQHVPIVYPTLSAFNKTHIS